MIFTIQNYIVLLFRVVEVHRTCEATATPDPFRGSGGESTGKVPT